MKAAFLALTAVISSLAGCASQLGYLAKQGGYLYRYSTGTQSIDSLLESPSTPFETREFLQKVKDIKRYAVTSVGLRDNANYTRYKSIDRDYLATVVQACDAASFTPYEWSYPFLGRLPYRGFYEPADAEAEAARLKKDGYDVLVRKVDAFSTLGFTQDPVYSFMEKYSPYELASVIIHEQTHATVWVNGQTDFNEELANFVGEIGAFGWIAERFGVQSPEYQAALDAKADSDLFVSKLKELGKSLAELYSSRDSRQDKLEKKAEIIGAFRKKLADEAGTVFRSPDYRKVGRIAFNNAYLSLYALYTDDVPLLRSFYEQRCGSDIRVFMRAVEKLARTGDVKKQIREELPGVSVGIPSTAPGSPMH